MIKLYIHPNFTSPDKADGGIRRVVEAQIKYLPEFGIEVVDNPDNADVIMNHGTSLIERQGVPMISCSHGLYWHDYDWGSWAHVANERVVESMIRADAITAPSYWVSNAISRGMLCKPTVIYHGVDTDEFKPDSNPSNWVLWNKARTDPVSSDEWLNEIARRMPDVRFVTTFGQERENVHIIGAIPYDEMKKYIAKAGLYLCTARETMGIGTLEALSCGVPVVGWDYGGQSEIIIQGKTGYLAPFENYEALEKCIRGALDNRETLSKNCRQDAIERWQWKDKIKQYAQIVHDMYLIKDPGAKLLDGKPLPPKISVIITSYNLGEYLQDTLLSVHTQKIHNTPLPNAYGEVPSHECIIVDDYSTDNTKEIAMHWVNNISGRRFKYHKTPENLGLSGARNFGFEQAKGKYIIYLDADDMLAPNALELLSNALDQDSSIHIAYGHLDTISEDGTGQRRNATKDGRDLFPFPEFSWRKQMAHLNQLHYSAMMRREVLENSGGYRVRDWRAEDASFWCRVTSHGYRAKKVTEKSTLIYRLRSNSKGATERKKYNDNDGNWCAWYPWALADTARDGERLNLRDNSELPNVEIVPFGAQGKRPRSWSRYRKFWNVRHHQYPKLSIIIPVGPGHKRYVIDALDSLVAQDFQDWEAIVINDTGDDWTTIQGAPYAKVITPKNKNPNAKGAGLARNVGVSFAKGEGIVYLDADDYMLPGALSAMWEAWEENGKNCVVYGDWISPTAQGEEPTYYKAFDFSCDINQEYMFMRRPIHAVTALYPAWAHDKAGGYNEEMGFWEDWDYLIRMYGVVGLCGIRVEQAIIAYRHDTGQRRIAASHTEVSKEKQAETKAANDKMRNFLYNEYKDFYKGIKKMACRKCPDNKIYNKPMAELPQAQFEALMVQNGDGMILRYLGGGVSKLPIKGPATRKTYTVMNTPDGRLIYNVHPEDAEALKMRTRKGKQLFIDFQQQVAPKPATVMTPPPAALLPDMPKMDTSVWDDLPEDEPKIFTFKTVKEFNAWLATNPAQDELIAVKLSEQNGKNRKAIINGINKALNA